MTSTPLASITAAPLPALHAPDARAARRTVEFFTANIRNPNTRKAFARAATESRRTKGNDHAHKPHSAPCVTSTTTSRT